MKLKRILKKNEENFTIENFTIENDTNTESLVLRMITGFENSWRTLYISFTAIKLANLLDKRIIGCIGIIRKKK